MARGLRRRCASVAVILASLSVLAFSSASAVSVRPQSLSATTFIPSMLRGVSGTTAVYELGWTSCHQRYCLQLLRSSNGGVDFEPVAAPPVAPSLQPQFGPFNQLTFATPEIGYATIQNHSVTTLYTTRNGAQSWRRLPTPAGTSIFAFAATAKMLYAITEQCTLNDTICNNFHFIRETPSAKTWTAVAVPFGFPAAERDDAYGQPGTLVANGSNVWLYEQNSYGALIAASTDSGATFSEFPSPKLGSVSGCALTATSSTSLWAQCPTGMNVSFFYSSDSGEQWSSVTGPKQFSGTGGGAFDPVTSTLGYLATGLNRPSGAVYRVREDARTSSVVGRLVCGDILSMDFINPQRGLALCTSRDGATVSLEVTSNGSRTWYAVHTSSNS